MPADEQPSAAVSAAVIADGIIRRFEETNAARDRALTEGRQIVRLAANTVRAVHRGENAQADQLAEQAERMLSSLLAELEPYPGIYWAGYVQDAMKEYAEARITAALVRNESLPTPTALGVADAAYLNALAEAASELRRRILDVLRAGEPAAAERLLEAMEEIYDALITVDFPDAITGGLRRTTDSLRAVLERTRADVTIAVRQHRLEQALRRAEATLTPDR